jgi:protease I
MKLKDKKIAIFVANIFEDLEFWYPNIRMKEEGAEVIVIGPKAESYSGKHGLTAKADQGIDSVNAEEFDALIIPGGYSPDHMRRVPEMVEFVKAMDDQGKIIATICHAAWMLASAEVINDREVTSFYSIKIDLMHAGANWVDKEVVRDGNIISSRNPNDLPAFCRAIIDALS